MRNGLYAIPCWFTLNMYRAQLWLLLTMGAHTLHERGLLFAFREHILWLRRRDFPACILDSCLLYCGTCLNLLYRWGILHFSSLVSYDGFCSIPFDCWLGVDGGRSWCPKISEFSNGPFKSVCAMHAGFSGCPNRCKCLLHYFCRTDAWLHWHLFVGGILFAAMYHFVSLTLFISATVCALRAASKDCTGENRQR